VENGNPRGEWKRNSQPVNEGTNTGKDKPVGSGQKKKKRGVVAESTDEQIETGGGNRSYKGKRETICKKNINPRGAGLLNMKVFGIVGTGSKGWNKREKGVEGWKGSCPR